MRIAYISYEYPPDSANGGIATYVEQVARMMKHRGNEVEVFASSPHRGDEQEICHGVLIHWIREVNRNDFGVLAGHRFADCHRKTPFDVLEGPEYHADARKAIQLVDDIPLVVRMHTPSAMLAKLNRQPSLSADATIFFRGIQKLAGILLGRHPAQSIHFTAGSWMQDQDHLEAAHARVAEIVAPPCLDLCRHAKKRWQVEDGRILHAPYPYAPQNSLLEIPLPAGRPTIGYVGRLERRKGIETFLRAIPKILRQHPEARFRLVGAVCRREASGEPYDEWIRRELGPLMSQVEIVGKIPLEKISEAYESFDICALPSLWENFPNTCLEAMAAGRAVIGSSAGGMAEMLDHGRCGLLTPPGRSGTLADHVITLLDSPDRAAELGRAARNRVLAAYNRETIGNMMERLYLKAIELKKKSLLRMSQ